MSTQPCSREVVLVLDADSDSGRTTAHRLLQAGCRVAVTARHTAPLTRIMHGYSASQLIAIAADTSDAAQFDHLIHRIERRFGQAVDRIVSSGSEVQRLPLAS
jgi:NADP-dependent 3-hydroxy acid dehydrogenase YdfG